MSVAVARAKDAPFVKHDEVPLVGGGEGRIFVFEAPVAGAAPGDRIAVLVEELETGLLGGGTLAVAEAAPGRQ